MAVLRVLYYDLTAFVKHQLNILIILIAGITVSSFSLCFYYGTAVTYAENTYHFDTGPREIKAVFSKETSAEGLSDFIEKNKPEAEEINLLDLNALLRCAHHFDLESEDEATPDTLGVVCRYTTGKLNIRSGRWFEDGDRRQNNIVISHGIIVPDGGESLTINGIQYNIIGSVSDSNYTNCVFADIDTFLNANQSAAIILRLKNVPSNEQLAEIESSLRKLDENINFFPPTEPNNNTNIWISFLQLLIMPIFISAFSFISVFSLYRFWLVHCRKTHAVYKTCGLRTSTFSICLVLEVAIITAIGFIAGATVFYLIYTLGNPTEILRMLHFAELAMIYAASLIICLAATLPSIIRAVKLSPVDMKEGRK